MTKVDFCLPRYMPDSCQVYLTPERTKIRLPEKFEPLPLQSMPTGQPILRSTRQERHQRTMQCQCRLPITTFCGRAQA